MGTEIRSCILFFHALLLLQCLRCCSTRKTYERDWNITAYKKQQGTKDNHPPSYAKKDDNYSQKRFDQMRVNEGDRAKGLEKHIAGNHKGLEVNIFFTDSDLQVGRRIPIYFPIKEPSTKPPLLSRKEADSIPFSSSKLSYLLAFFSFSTGSPQAKAMEDTLRHCEFEPVNGETKFCATSLESMLDSALDIFGTNTSLKVLTTNHLTKSSTIFQNYTVADEPKVVSAPKMVACHTLPYPYTVFYCHGQKTDKLFKVNLLGDNGGRIDAAAICHMETSQWDPNHVAFQVLKTEPGSSPVCHFFPEDNLVWVTLPSVP